MIVVRTTRVPGLARINAVPMTGLIVVRVEVPKDVVLKLAVLRIAVHRVETRLDPAGVDRVEVGLIADVAGRRRRGDPMKMVRGAVVRRVHAAAVLAKTGAAVDSVTGHPAATIPTIDVLTMTLAKTVLAIADLTVADQVCGAVADSDRMAQAQGVVVPVHDHRAKVAQTVPDRAVAAQTVVERNAADRTEKDLMRAIRIAVSLENRVVAAASVVAVDSVVLAAGEVLVAAVSVADRVAVDLERDVQGERLMDNAPAVDLNDRPAKARIPIPIPATTRSTKRLKRRLAKRLKNRVTEPN